MILEDRRTRPPTACIHQNARCTGPPGATLPCSRVLHCSGTPNQSSPSDLLAGLFALYPSPLRQAQGDHKITAKPQRGMKPIGCDRLGGSPPLHTHGVSEA